MFEKLYLKQQNSVEKPHYDLLYEEYQHLLKQNKRLERQSNLIVKQSDRQLNKNRIDLYKHKRKNNRLETILKQGDRQGKTLLTKTYTLEDKVAAELEYEKELLQEITDTQKEVVFTMGSIG